MAFELGNLTGMLGNLGQLLPSTNELANQVVTGAVASVVLSGLKTDSGLNAIDPLHLFHKDGSSTVVGSRTTISATALASMPPDARSQILAQNPIIT